jgi:GTP pyrophosphokinase
MAIVMTPSKSQINRAGQILRRRLRGHAITDADVDRALAIVQEYRACHQYRLLKANMGLRSMVQTEGCRVEVSQRLKRITTIVDKLRREPTMALGNMQDIGGCRAVLDSIPEVRRVEHRLKKNRSPLRVFDYIARPRASGYRAVHVIVAYPDRNGEEWSIEVQLRTRTMHEWAIVVERLSGRLQADLKSGNGPPPVLAWLEVISEAMALDERGEPVPDALLERIRILRAAALPYIGGPA